MTFTIYYIQKPGPNTKVSRPGSENKIEPEKQNLQDKDLHYHNLQVKDQDLREKEQLITKKEQNKSYNN